MLIEFTTKEFEHGNERGRVSFDPGRIHAKFVFKFAHVLVGVKGDDSVKNKNGVVP